MPCLDPVSDHRNLHTRKENTIKSTEICVHSMYTANILYLRPYSGEKMYV